MSNIAKQIEAFHKLKSEVESDLENFMVEMTEKQDENGVKFLP